jgi:hypothetical protein
LATSNASAQDAALPAGVTPTPAGERRVGIGYALWHTTANWETNSPKAPWGHPELGNYVSSDRSVMQQHARWLADAGVDFVLLDWSNDLDTDTRDQHGPPDKLFIENTTPLLFATFAGVHPHPRIAFLVGYSGNALRDAAKQHNENIDIDAVLGGKLRAKCDQVYQQYVQHKLFGPMLETYLGKPLLLVYLGVPCPFQTSAPTWTDPRFTVRFMTAYLAQQPSLLGPGGVSRFGYWSWEERRLQSYTVFDGHPEAMTAVAAWRGSDTPGRANGDTFRANWARARQVGPRFVLAGTFNEWWQAEQPTAEGSKDIEPSREFGDRYLQILREQATLFKAGK